MNILKQPNFNFGTFLFLFGTMLLTTSCEEDNNTLVITVDDAAELVAFSMANRTYGAVNDLNYVAEAVIDLINCGESETNNRTLSEDGPAENISVTSEFTESYSRACEGEEIITYNFTADQLLTSVRFDLDQQITGDWTVAGVQENAVQYTYNGPYSRNGSWTYNLKENHTDEVIYSTNFIEVTYDPSSERITGGTATFTLDGTSTVHEPYSYSGDVAFSGSDLALITFATGEQYELNLETGDITPI